MMNDLVEDLPGLVEASLIDARGKRWTFVDKTVMIMSDSVLSADSSYPQAGLIGCTELGTRLESDGSETVTISRYFGRRIRPYGCWRGR